MKLVLLLGTLLVISACASSGTRSVNLSRSSTDYTIVCPTGWTECEQKADAYCPDLGYFEVRRFGDGVTTAGRGGDARSTEIFRRATEGESRRDRSMTIRCK